MHPRFVLVASMLSSVEREASTDCLFAMVVLSSMVATVRGELVKLEAAEVIGLVLPLCST